ncbi:hypothetical protein F2Q69_00029248 [Brassica cretica]|uniref:Uncharacterized protein n=1 Tax=Brassica cretica TaxID=69181 RepID=A0A8S9S101_BRACR|nr:hypothetical protein F2Q69_00029248 [Brassica cretica]
MDVESRGSITRLSKLCGKTGNRCFDWSSLNRWIKFSGLLTALQTLELVSSNQLQRRDTYMEKTTRRFSEGMQVDDQVEIWTKIRFTDNMDSCNLCRANGIITANVIYVVLSMDKDKIYG